MGKHTRTMRIDDELWEEVDKAGKKLRPKEKRTEFFEKAAWERINRKKTNQIVPKNQK